MRNAVKDPGLIMALAVLVIESLGVLRLRKMLSEQESFAARRAVTSEEDTFVKFADIVYHGYGLD